jgi:hypothetical protein
MRQRAAAWVVGIESQWTARGAEMGWESFQPFVFPPTNKTPPKQSLSGHPEE